jgi:hypothetical protein
VREQGPSRWTSAALALLLCMSGTNADIHVPVRGALAALVPDEVRHQGRRGPFCTLGVSATRQDVPDLPGRPPFEVCAGRTRDGAWVNFWRDSSDVVQKVMWDWVGRGALGFEDSVRVYQARYGPGVRCRGTGLRHEWQTPEFRVMLAGHDVRKSSLAGSDWALRVQTELAAPLCRPVAP